MTEQTDLQACAARLDIALDDVFAGLQSLVSDVQQIWAGCAEEGRKPCARDLARLKPGIDAQLLGASSGVYGAGVVVEPGELSDERMFLEWWRVAGNDKTLPLKLNFNQRSENFYNYQSMSWFSIPRSHGSKVVAGPYVDLYGSDMYVLTFAQPIVFAGRFIGVVGADLPLHRFERVLIAHLMRLPQETLLVSAEGRVIAANTANWAVGDLAGRLLADAAGYCRQPLSDRALGWTLVSLPRARIHAAA